ncbi:MAG: ParB/RepB/Spo0J family partition protein [Anaerolineaceae bacterium]|nr:ParB/RepB/Spo0J family partition protein [Anaerolineaceae bacterium]
MARKGGLGKGLGALLPSNENTEGGSAYVSIGKIIPNPHQPRSKHNPESLHELAESIREHGILQPLVVTQDPETDQYILIAGERRLRAAEIAGFESVPVLVRQATDRQMLEIALVENVQRSDLTPLETAQAYRQLSEDFNLSHEEIATRVGKSRVSVTNTLRLLKLAEPVLTALAGGHISEGHARALLALNAAQAQTAALQTILRLDLSVRQTEMLVRKFGGEKPPSSVQAEPAPEIKEIEDRLRQALGTKVTLRQGKKGGTLLIHYYSDEELNTLVSQITQNYASE